MEITIFWIAWGIISFWALRTFYFSFTSQKLERLRKTAFVINLLAFAFGLYPLVSVIGVKNGFEGFSTINALTILFAVLLFASTAFFLTTHAFTLKFASIATIINTFSYLGIMYTLRPETFIFTLSDAPPVIAALLLLINNVVVLLLWQQLQLKDKKTKTHLSNSKRRSSKQSIAVFLMVTLMFVWFVYQKTQFLIDENNQSVELVSWLPEVAEFRKEVEENGRSKFGITIDHKVGPYSIIKVFESFPDHTTTFGWYRYDPKMKKIFRNNIANDTWEEVER